MWCRHNADEDISKHITQDAIPYLDTAVQQLTPYTFPIQVQNHTTATFVLPAPNQSMYTTPIQTTQHATPLLLRDVYATVTGTLLLRTQCAPLRPRPTHRRYSIRSWTRHGQHLKVIHLRPLLEVDIPRELKQQEP